MFAIHCQSDIPTRMDADPWRWFCGDSKSPTGEGNCVAGSACITLKDLTYGALNSTCIQHAIVCLGQLILLLIFFLLLATSNSVPEGALTGTELLNTFEVGSILYNVSAVLSSIVGLANFVVAASLYFSTSFLATHELVYLLVQGVAWLTIAISLRIRYSTVTYGFMSFVLSMHILILSRFGISSMPSSLHWNNPHQSSTDLLLGVLMRL